MEKGFTILSILLTVFAVIITHVIYRLILRPFMRLRSYRKVPGVRIAYSLGKKQLWTYNNLKEAPVSLNGDTPFLTTENNTLLLKNPDLRAEIRNLATRPMIMIIDHELAAEMIKNHDNYLHFFRNTILGNLYLKYSMAFSTGDEWKRQRKVISKAFDFDSMKKIIPIVEEVAFELLDSQTFTNGKEPQVLQSIFLKYTWENISRSFFGDNLKEYTVNGVPFAEALNHILKSQFPIFLSSQYQIFGEKACLWNPVIREQFRLAKEIGKVAEKMVKDVSNRINSGELKNADGRKGILELILESSKEQNETMTNRELIANFFSFSFAGTDTSTNTSTNALFCLATYPEAKKKVIEDIQANWDGKSPITIETINKMEYLHALIMETFRVMTPVPGTLPKVAKHDHMIGNLPIKKGSIVRPLFTPTWFSPKWISDPDVFRPERWIKGHEKQQQLKDVFIFNPFSFGQRVCIGQHFATAQVKIALCHFLTKFDFELPADFKLTPMIVRGPQEPEQPIKMLIRPKQVSN